MGYRVYRGTTPGTLAPLVDLPDVSAFSDSGLGDGQTFFYTVAAMNIAGIGPESGEVVATTFDRPGAPLNLVAEPGVGVGAVQVTWDPPASDGGTPVTAYFLCRSTTSGATGLCGSVGPSTSYTDGGAVLTTYYYTVYAVNAVGDGPAAAEACSKPFPWASALGC